ncbi:phage terminase large subunit family protein [Aeromonas aquatica]|uniref:phage terminase large subunit family protein n=1 Tax=Aeromonas aquatica TaxID=558964 RepID=UPI00068B527A|nr:terminase gpA endonuclease subunit [Aeromonas aquatica]
MYAKASRVRRDVIELVRAPSRTPLSESAKELLYVEQSGAMVPWDAALTPYMIEPMDTLKSRRYDSVIFVGPARTAKTVSLVDGWVMDTVARDRADMLIVQISEDKAREYSKKRLQRCFAASPQVRAALSPYGHDNNVHDIKTRAGNFLKVGWPSKTVFASSDWRRVALTDYDRMPPDIGGEGSGFILAGKRTQTFMSSGMVLAESSPGFEITDPGYRPATRHEAPPTLGILSLYNLGDRRLFMWQCPDCREWFEPGFELLQYDKEETDPARASKHVVIACPHCGSVYEEGQRVNGKPFKLQANAGGLWLPEGCTLDRAGRMHGEPRLTRTASFWQKGPTAAFQTWNQLVYKYVAALKVYDSTGDFKDLKATINVDQGNAFTPPRATERSAEGWASRRADLGVKVVPSWVRFLIATIDVQAGKERRFEVQVQGFGPGLESVIIDRFKIEKSRRQDPENPEKFVRVKPGVYDEDWDLITEKVVKKAYQIDDGSGRLMPILRTVCDSAGEDGVTDKAYAYFRRLKQEGLHRRFRLVKGSGRKGAPVIEERFPDNTGRSDRKAKVWGDVPVMFLNSDRLKDIASASLLRDEPGPRYIHFPDWLPERFFDELNAEERDAAGHWEKVAARNESFDLLHYAWSAIYWLKADKITDWDNPPLWAEAIDSNPEILDGSADCEVLAKPARRRRRSS